MKQIEIHPDAKALIFDCDGTLVDSMPLHMKSWEYAMNIFNLEFDYDFFFSKKGMKETDIINILSEKLRIPLDTHEILKAKHRYFMENIYEVKPIDEVVKIVLEHKNKLPMAVVSGGMRKIVYEELNLIGIKNYFNVILTADDNIKPKPAPDLFLSASQLLNVKAQNCQVFEDGDSGIQAALKANMIVTDIRNYIN
ncbi:HAD family hydrolase [Rosettibacter firmus]|uniref:HAD family hydrolase n=1 Tax=Rosettibacter firmus TaxID=3111522 RepID=UPI00336C108E